MSDLAIDLSRAEPSSPDAPAGIAISCGETVFTRLTRAGESEPDSHVQASAGQLAFWLVDNWWRLLAECVPPGGPTSDWRSAHDLAAMGGYSWPRLTIWGEGERIGLASRSDPPGVVGPVRYLTDALIYIDQGAFTRPALAFVDEVASQASGLAHDWAALRSALDSLQGERSDPEQTAWRMLEAQLGYDVDQAPPALLDALEAFEAAYGAGAVAEAALAAQGKDAAHVLEREIAVAESAHWQCDLARPAAAAGLLERARNLPPWSLAERAAGAVRGALGRSRGPLSNRDLGELLGVRPFAFRTPPGSRTRDRAYGVRLNTGRRRGEVVSLIAVWQADRRFEFARALGDVIWSKDEALGPLTRVKSERQKFQRAFAQALLCPYQDLIAYIGDDRSDGAFSAAAHHFLVAERVVRSLLVNKRDLTRARLDRAPRSFASFANDRLSFADAVEAA